MFPTLVIYDEVIAKLGEHPDGEKAAKAFKEWRFRGHNKENWGWLDWYTNGIPPRPNGNGHGPPGRASPPDARATDWQAEARKYAPVVTEEEP